VSDRPIAAVDRRTLWLIAALSGAAGLGYEMVWTRLLGVALGTEMYAVLGVVAGLFGGLALGGVLLSGRVARSPQPARLYAALELVIAVWGLVCVVLLPALAQTLPAWLGRVPNDLTLGVLTFLLPAIALLPATVAMGGTLAALARCLEGDEGSRPAVAGVYAANTFGAVVGTVLTVAVLFAQVGLRGTLIVLALCNVTAACLAMRLRVPTWPVTTSARPNAGLRLARDRTTLFATGLLGVAVEVLIMRAAAQFLSDTIYTFAGLLAAYLLGSALGGAIRQRVPLIASARTRAALLSLTALTVLLTLAGIAPLAQWAMARGLVDPLSELSVAALLFLPSAMAMGALFADLLEDWRLCHGDLGRAAGINALGAAVAPLAAAFILIPGIGTMAALAWVGAAYLTLLPWRRDAALMALPAALCAAVLILRPIDLPLGLPPGGRQVASIEGPMVSASVVDDAGGARYLEVNGHFRMGGTSSERSDFRQALLPLLLHPAPQQALYLGVGTGATLSGALRYPNLDVRGIEISAEVVELLRYFNVPGRPEPTPHVSVADARRYVAADTARYDVIVADNFHPALEGSGSLYTLEHFRSVKQRLRPTGVFCQWLPLYQLDPHSLQDLVRTYLAVFPQASAWLAHFSIRMPMLALCAHPNDAPLGLAQIETTLANPALQRVVQPLELDTPLAVAGSYLGDAAALRRFAGAGALNSDDHPVIALNGAANIAALTAPPQVQLLALIHTLQTPTTTPLVVEGVTPERLTAYWRARDRFLEAGAAIVGDPRGRALIDAATPGLLAAIGESGEFDPAYRPLLAMADALASNDPSAARALLTQMISAAPARPEAAQRLRQLGDESGTRQGEKRIR